MTTEFAITLIAVAVGIVVILSVVRKWFDDLKKGQSPSEELVAWLKSTNERLDTQNKNIVATLQSSTKDLNVRLDNAAKFIAAVQRNIGEMSEIGRSMKELEEFLRSPKLRGNIGEQVLKEVLTQLLPKQAFALQHTFKSGSTVDAVVKTGNGIIPVDAKFPIDNFRRMVSAEGGQERKKFENDFRKDVQKHINDISQKYILTDEGTIDYALMYLPSEAVYYEIVNDAKLYEYSTQKRVLPTSPTTFYAYLRSILMAMEGQRIEKEAKEILSLVRSIQKDYLKADDNLGILSRHITNAYNQLANVNKSFSHLGQKISMPKHFFDTSGKDKEQLQLSGEEGV